MAWAKPEYSKQEVNAAGRVLIRSATWEGWTAAQFIDFDYALDVINNWRASHGYPLNTFQMNLRSSGRRFDHNLLVAQRIKRLVSIENKLIRQPSMKLTQMQDLGGCRAVLSSSARVRQLANYYLEDSGIKHELASVDDYVKDPKQSGYRGVHLVYRYFSDKKAKEMYNGLKIEMQIRSRYQHAWATAVETVGTFVQQALKSSQGHEDWLRFFALMGSTIAIRERAPLVPNTPTLRKDLIRELKQYAAKLDVERRLRAYGHAMRAINEGTQQARYYLLQLDPTKNELSITGFAMNELGKAQERYALAEREVQKKPGTDAVLVSVESLAALQRAYPNYFADTRVFVALLSQALTGEARGIAPTPLKIDELEL